MHSLSPHEFSSLRERLSLHFEDKMVATVLRSASMFDWFVTREDKPVNLSAPLEDSVTALLTSLWVLGESVPAQLIFNALGESATRLRDAGWLTHSDEQHVRSPVSILPCDGLWIVTDHVRDQSKSDSVFFPDSSSVNSFCCFPASDGSHLDIGTGCGLTALAAGRNGQQVNLNDLNPRALLLTQMSFELNGFAAPRIHQGDFTDVTGEFDSIAFNLPVPADGGLSPDEPVHSRSPHTDLLEKLVDWLPGHLTENGRIIAHSRFPTDISGFRQSLEDRCTAFGWRGLAVYAPNNGTGFFGVMALQRSGPAGFNCLEFDPKDTVWITHWEWPAILDLLRAAPVSDSLSLSCHLELVQWVRPLARIRRVSEQAWDMETIKLFRVELSGPDAQAFRFLAEGHSLEETIDRIDRNFPISRQTAEELVNQLASRLLSAGLASVSKS